MSGITYVQTDAGRRCIVDNPADGRTVASLLVGCYLNYCSLSQYKDFIGKMMAEQKAVQSNFTALCLEWFQAVANEKYYDDRNKASVDIGRTIAGLSLTLKHKAIRSFESVENMELDYHDGAAVEEAVAYYLKASYEDFSLFTNQALREHKTLQQSFSRLCVSWFKAIDSAYPGSKDKHVITAHKALTCTTYLPFI